jgi:hypothetical protein
VGSGSNLLVSSCSAKARNTYRDLCCQYLAVTDHLDLLSCCLEDGFLEKSAAL